MEDLQDHQELHDEDNNQEFVIEEVELTEDSKGEFSYKEVSEMSEVTEESYPEGLAMLKEGAKDLENYERLMEQTKQKLKIIDDDTTSIASTKLEKSDEFLRNFFIKFGMKKTLDSFQQEWFELKAKGQLDISKMPALPEIYKINAELSDELSALQQDLDEARITAEKARSTYDKLRKQRDFQKINHRRVQQEKQKLNNDIGKNKKIYEQYQENFKQLSTNYEAAVKEKMLMKLEKDRLLAKVENLEQNLRQIEENQLLEQKEKEDIAKRLEAQKKKTDTKSQLKPKGTPSIIPPKDRPNTFLTEQYEPINSHLSMIKTFKGHLMGVTCLAYNPKKSIVATGSDDTTWKMWTVPNGDLIMSGEGHLDWIGGMSFNPKGDLLATCSGDGNVKIWDFVNASCAYTFSEHGQPVWKCDWHDSGDLLISCAMDHTIKLWDLNMPKSRYTFRGHVDSVNSVKFQPFSCMFVSGAGDKTVSLWDIRTNLCVQTFYGHNNAVNSVSFNIRVIIQKQSVQGDAIASADCDGITKVWDVRMVKELHQFDSGLASANNAIFDKSCTYVLVASEDATVKVFNMQTKEKESELKGHEDAVLDLCFDNAKEGILVTSSSDCSFRIWQ